MDDISAQWQILKVFEPALSTEATDALKQGWKKAINGAVTAAE